MRNLMKSASIFSLVFAMAVVATNVNAAARDDSVPEFRFAKIFTDHMVVQQAKPIKVWGWAKPGSKVSVTLTQDRTVGEQAAGQAAELAEARGVRRPAPDVDDDGYSVTVQYVEKNPPKLATQTIETTADAGADGRWSVEFAPAEASFQSTWIVAQSGGEVIAVEDALIGEIWVCAGQSNMVWRNFNRKDREAASADFPGLRYVAWEDSWYKPLDDVRKNIEWRVCTPESVDGFSSVPYLYGMYLHRYLKVPVGIINVARGGTTGQTWCLRDELDNVDSEIIRTILNDYDAQTLMWEDPRQVERIMAEWEAAVEAAKAEHETKVATAKAEGKSEPKLRLPKPPGDPRSGWSPPAGLFNATVLPIKELGVRGVLYYQGENNNFLRWTQYESTFPKIPASFRKAFGDENLPFGCISQPGWGTFGLDPEVATVAEGYAIVRDIQNRALKDDANAGMIATYPTGNSYIHPAEKLPVAEYASLWALANVYEEPVMHRGTTYRELKRGDGKLYLFFDVDPLVQSQIKPDKEPPYWLVLPCPREGKADFQGFIIAGEDRRWYPAQAKHAKLDGQHCVEVWSDLVEEPVAVRYGWANWPTGNLVGRNRLPMPTFRSDNWPIPEGVAHTPEAKTRSSERLSQLKDEGAKQALDRKIRQMLIDLPQLEKDLHFGKYDRSEKRLIESRIAGIELLLDALMADQGVSRYIEDSQPAVAERIKATQEAVRKLKTEAAAIVQEE